ncbi:aldose epimerase family protein [Flavobacterium psychrotolerans]|uniref:Aldose 1-epimerase n=1 Tax=Flavobacterium psychrotolerans TaxID=2169410 RepID=A0A2U1JJ54_9FLAO|nr:aldose epimerase family protein [Flavobacterium psychrotolerans]PWA05172.1 galactose-1-epimerase [Flavobacterium psychrotolerans]
MSYFKADFSKKLFGLMPDGEAVFSFELSNKNGMQLKIINFGAAIVALKMPLKNGNTIDVVLGFDNLEAYINSYELESAPYLGATIGRFAGRIDAGAFNLNDKTFHLNKNNNGHSLHGGMVSFSQKVWKVKKVNYGSNPSITLTYFSPNKEENYPGDLTVELIYTLSEENELIIEYKATTTEDTIVNLTHHSYFNLEGHNAMVTDQKLFVNAEKLLEKTPDDIPTGRFLRVANGTFDFTSPRECPSKIDNTFVLENETELAASLFSENNNLKMSVYTNQPGVHVYVGGNCFNAIKGKENADYHSTSGICFETQNFPDAPNHPHFPSSILKSKEMYYHKTIYKFQSF